VAKYHLQHLNSTEKCATVFRKWSTKTPGEAIRSIMEATGQAKELLNNEIDKIEPQKKQEFNKKAAESGYQIATHTTPRLMQLDGAKKAIDDLYLQALVDAHPLGQRFVDSLMAKGYSQEVALKEWEKLVTCGDQQRIGIVTSCLRDMPLDQAYQFADFMMKGIPKNSEILGLVIPLAQVIRAAGAILATASILAKQGHKGLASLLRNAANYLRGRGGAAAEGEAGAAAGEGTNPVLDRPRIDSGAKVDFEKPTYDASGNIIREFHPTARAHGFPAMVDNYAAQAQKFPLADGGMLYQLKGSYNGVPGRYEWILKNDAVTHRMFIEGGTINGVPIKP
jgi:hypothetical protein